MKQGELKNDDHPPDEDALQVDKVSLQSEPELVEGGELKLAFKRLLQNMVLPRHPSLGVRSGMPSKRRRARMGGAIMNKQTPSTRYHGVA